MSETEIPEKITLYFSTVPGNHEVNIFISSLIVHQSGPNYVKIAVINHSLTT